MIAVKHALEECAKFAYLRIIGDENAVLYHDSERV